MDGGSVDIIESWDSRSLPGGLEELHSIADSGFTGVATAARTWLFMLNGNVIGVFNGTVDSFKGTDGTVYDAPDPSIVLLLAMKEYDGETQAQYFTDDTPIREVHSTLTDSGFSGYLKLSENVISGDYYVLYYGGRSMSVAIVGNAQRVVTGDEAFELATEEVGIYEVVSVDISILELPDPEDEPAENTHRTDSEPMSEAPDQPPTNPDSSSEPRDSPSASREGASNTADAENLPPTDQEESTEVVTDQSDTDSDTDTDPTPKTGSNEPTNVPDESSANEHEPTHPQTESPDDSSPKQQQTPKRETNPETAPPNRNNDRFSEEEQWRKTRTIPALDPEDSTINESSNNDPRSSEPPPPEHTKNHPTNGNSENTNQIKEVEAQIRQQQEKIESLVSKIKKLEQERNELASERDKLRTELQNNESSNGTQQSTTQGVSLPVNDALEQTDLFVRYGSKSDATLEDVRYGEIDESELTDNLTLETHTRFSTEDAIVDNQPFNEFLSNRIEYQFVKWVTTKLPFEIRNTGNEAPLKDLYHLLPRIDRVELNGKLTAIDEDEEEISRSFDIIIRDRMGDPLIVANINHGRDPADAGMMENLTSDASDVAISHEQLGGVFLVTASFFSPDALETATEATGGGFLSRDKRKNYVKLSRKTGFHLCLIEARENAFHITSPEL